MEVKIPNAQATGSAGTKSGILYPMMLIATVAVIIFSVLGIATILGYMPSALPRGGPDAKVMAGTEPCPE